MIKTVKCRMNVSADDRLALLDTLEKFAAACNDALAYARESGAKHRYAIQSGIYKALKVRHGLTAMYAVRACDRVAGSLAAKRYVRNFRASSVTTDKALLRYIPAAESVSISTTQGRRKIPLMLGEYQRGLLAHWTYGMGQMCVDQKGNFYVCMRINLPTPVAGGADALGIDLGIRRIATLSNGVTFSGRTLNRKRERYARTKASLQRRGTKGAKRTLKRLAGREFRFQRDNNHAISKQIVALAKESDSYLVMEDLTGIRQRSTNKGRRFRRMVGRWNFYTLKQYIAYKAEAAGVGLVFVNPAYTSQTCPFCRDRGHRKGLHFSCSCGFVGDADKVGAFNVAAQGAQSIALKSPAFER